MKKICSLLLALTLVLTMLAGCQEAPVANEKDSAQVAVSNYMDALAEFDFKTASFYTGDPEAAMANFPYENIDDAVEKTVATMPENILKYEDSITDFTEVVFDVMKENTDYEIKNISEDGENYVATVEFTTVDTEKFDIETMMNDLMANIDVNELTTQLLSDGTITEDMSEEEIYDILFPALFIVMSDTVKESDVATVTTEETITVVKANGKWVVDMESVQ